MSQTSDRREFTEDVRAKLVRKKQQWARVFGALSALSFALTIVFVVAQPSSVDNPGNWLLIAFILLGWAAVTESSKADDYRYSLSVPDLDERIEEIQLDARRSRDLANSAHDRIAQIERMGQQGRVVIPDTLNVRLTKENDND